MKAVQTRLEKRIRTLIAKISRRNIPSADFIVVTTSLLQTLGEVVDHPTHSKWFMEEKARVVAAVEENYLNAG